MADDGEFKKLYIKKYPAVAGRTTPEARFWKKFKSQTLLKDYAAITHLNFSPSSPHDLAVSSSTRVQVYDAASLTVKKTISRFKDVVYSAEIRRDGRVLVAGDATGLVQLFDLGSRVVLRGMKGHDSPVHLTTFLATNTHILSGGDDASVKIWDIASGSAVTTFDNDHTDYVRTGMASQDNPHLVVTGSYDHTVKLFDTRVSPSSSSSEGGGCILTLPHGAPVECVKFFPTGSGGLIASSGGNEVKIWDILSGRTVPLQVLSNHQKTITSFCFDGNGGRLLTGSLDRHVKVYDIKEFQVVQSFKYTAPILSVAMSPDDTHLAVGMSTGLLSIRKRMAKTGDMVMSSSSSMYGAGVLPSFTSLPTFTSTASKKGKRYHHFMRGQDYVPDNEGEGAVWIESRRKAVLKSYDKFLKAFKYGDALDAVLSTNQPPLITVSLLEELIHRDGLRIALSGRDDISLEPVVRFLVKHINNPRYCSLLVDVANVVLDMYTPIIGQSIIIDELFAQLHRKVQQEIEMQGAVQGMMGLLETVVAAGAKA